MESPTTIGILAAMASVMAASLAYVVRELVKVKQTNGGGKDEMAKFLMELATATRATMDNTVALRERAHEIVNLQKDITHLISIHEQGARSRDEKAEEFRKNAVAQIIKTNDSITNILLEARSNGRVALNNCPIINNPAKQER